MCLEITLYETVVHEHRTFDDPKNLCVLNGKIPIVFKSECGYQSYEKP